MVIKGLTFQTYLPPLSSSADVQLTVNFPKNTLAPHNQITQCCILEDQNVGTHRFETLVPNYLSVFQSKSYNEDEVIPQESHFELLLTVSFVTY
jgi:hypothetical protein